MLLGTFVYILWGQYAPFVTFYAVNDTFLYFQWINDPFLIFSQVNNP